ncbi:MAG TPA: anthranilate synthase component I [Longimicrobiales bacterium]|nr:anthranilate synthase component I [Longimicrobiales bacterium]
MLKPTRDEFVHFARDATLVPVWREFLFDVDTAVTAYAKLRQAPFGFLLESVVGGEKWARHTFLGTAPREAWRIEPGGAATSRWTPAGGWEPPVPSADPLGELDAILRARRLAQVPGLPRFVGGAVGYLGYDVIRLVERLPEPKPDPLGAPWALLLFTDTLLVIDNLFGRALAVATVDVTDADEPELRRRYDEAAEAVDAMVRRLAEGRAPAPLDLSEPAAPSPINSSYTRERFEAHVQRIREYIAAGDAFQVVLSQRLGVPLEAEPFDLYRALRSLNPSPYLFFLELDDLTLVGSSPEVLVRAEEGRVVVRPIAGTRRRGKDDDEDAALVADLLADEKERAEHLMLVDLGRNDVGRVARFGTVKVPEFMGIEKYSHVLHLVSQVEGELRPGLSAVDVFRACFPAGTVSGAPKIRAMEIIDELEPIARGPYAGAVGYFAYGGQAMDTAIAIRTLVARDGEAFVQAGAGIVADSNPAAEFEETLAKARALLRVVDSAPRPTPGADR